MADELSILIRAQNMTQAAFVAARQELAGLGQEVGKTNTLLGGLKAGLGAAGVALSATAILGFAKSVVDTASDLGDMAERFDISFEAAQRFKFAAEQSGATLDDVGAAVKFMSRALGEGDDSFRGALHDVGLNLEQIRAMKPEDAFRALAEAVRGIKDPFEQARVGTLLFGRGWSEMAATIKAGVDDVGNHAHVMSNETGAALKQAGDSLKEFQSIATVVFGTFIAKNLHPTQAAIDAFTFTMDQLGISIENVDAAAKPAGVSLFNLGRNTKQLADARSMSAEAADAITKSLAAERKALDDAAEAHRRYIQGLRDTASGATAIKLAKDWLEALKGTIPITKMTVEAQDKLNKVMGEARDVYHAAGKDVPDDIRAVYEATFRLTDTIPLIKRWREELAHSADGIVQLKTIADKLAHETWPATIDGLDRIFIVQGRVIQQSKTLGERMQSSFGDIAAILDAIPGKFAEIGAMAARAGSAIMKNLDDGNVFGAIVAGATAAIGIIGKLIGVGPTEYEKRMRAAVEETKKLQAELIKSHGSMQQLIADADLVGINIKEAFNWKDPEAFKNVVSDLDQKTQLLNAAMEEYGFTWEDLGERARGAKLGQLFDELFAKTDILRTAGIDYHTILERQAGDYSKLVQAAIRTGTEIPIAMQPVLQDMIDLGLLTDENGEKLTDLTDIKWAKSMTDGFKDVTDAIHELTDALTNGVGGALEKIGRTVVHPRIEPVYGDSGEDPSTASTGGIVGHRRVLPFRRGGFVPSGTDTVPAMLTPGEIVLNAAQQKRIASALSGADGDIHITLDMGDLGKQMVTIARKDAARGGLRARVSSGRSY